MFKKRYAEMDLYQEFQRSHERVKVMLNEEIGENADKNLTAPSAQENLQRFIQQHEAEPFLHEHEEPEQNFINLETETMPEEESNTEFSPINNNNASNIQENNLNHVNFNNYQNQFYKPPQNDLYYESESPQDFTSAEMPPPQNYEKINHPVKHRRVEDELDDIIRDALNNIGPYNSTTQSDIDPELLKMLKKLLLKNNMSSNWSDNNFLRDVAESGYGVEFDQNDLNKSTNSYSPDGSLNSNSQPNINLESQIKPVNTSFDQQLQNQQSPPKAPTKASTVKRPGVKQQVGVFDPSFATMDFDDDSSLALTKKEISTQVKNLIRETLEENTQETSKPNDLLELEKQLKEHIEKIKHSRKINYDDE